MAVANKVPLSNMSLHINDIHEYPQSKLVFQFQNMTFSTLGLSGDTPTLNWKKYAPRGGSRMLVRGC